MLYCTLEIVIKKYFFLSFGLSAIITGIVSRAIASDNSEQKIFIEIIIFSIMTISLYILIIRLKNNYIQFTHEEV